MPRAVLEALARAVTDAGADPDGIEDDAARAVVQAIPRGRLRRYADSLVEKRAREVARALPRSLRLCPWALDAYRAWLRRHPAPAEDTVLPPGLAEALRAIDVLAGACDPPWVADLVRFEAYRAASACDGVERTAASRWPVHRLAEEVAGGVVPVDPDEEPHAYRFGATPRWRPRP